MSVRIVLNFLSVGRVWRICKSKKDGQYNGQKKKDNVARQITNYKTPNRKLKIEQYRGYRGAVDI